MGASVLLLQYPPKREQHACMHAREQMAMAMDMPGYLYWGRWGVCGWGGGEGGMLANTEVDPTYA